MISRSKGISAGTIINEYIIHLYFCGISYRKEGTVVVQLVQIDGQTVFHFGKEAFTEIVFKKIGARFLMDRQIMIPKFITMAARVRVRMHSEESTCFTST